MASPYRKAVVPSSSNLDQRQLQLLALVAMLCPPFRTPPDPAQCRLIVDSRLPWGTLDVDGQSSWLYLPQPARVHRLAGCLVLSAR